MSATNGGNLFESLNQAQRRAVSSSASTVAILAGPGSGKTHTLTTRVVWLIDHVQYQPCDILVATFTVKAAREMKERMGRALGDGRERKIVLGTFHSIARRYLAAYGQRIGLDPKFGIADDSDSRGIVTRICKRLDVQLEVPKARAYISKKKAGGSTVDQPAKNKKDKSVESKAYESCYQEYQAQLELSNLLDYDDLLVRCVELLRKYPSCVSNIQAVLIDEYQDTNGIQFELMKLFAQYNRRITIVGDPDQSIYGWRSAEIRNLHRFLRDFPGTDEISLEENYRSSSSILDISLKVIQQDKERYQKALLPVHEKATRPVLRRLKNQMDEADWIVSEIKRAKSMSGNMINSDDIAILLRSASLSRHIESALGKAGIAYRMVGGFKFYERTEIKIILDYLRLIYHPDNNDALARIINVPKRGIGPDTIKALIEEAERNSLSVWNLLVKHCRGDRTAKTNIRKQTEQKISGDFFKIINGLRLRLREPKDGVSLDLVGAIEQLLRDLQFEKYLEDTCPHDHDARWTNVQEFVGLAGEFMRDQMLAEEDMLPDVEGVQQYKTDDILGRFLANVSLASDKQTNDQDQDKPMITVSTIHAAKGLEWPIVFIPGVYKGSIPHARSDDEAEERRLLYVAMTRAQTLLYLSHPLYSSTGDSSSLEVSPFIEHLSSNHFLPQGPSFDRKLMLQVAKILRRQLPSEDTIYKNMPVLSPIEDNLFPIDPNEPRQFARSSNDGASAQNNYKRRKTQQTTSSAQIAPESVEGWNAPYATTMERTSSFTLPGFTTANAQRVAEIAEQLTLTSKPTAPAVKVGTNRRPPGQRSLLGFIVKEHDQSKVVEQPALPPPLQSRPPFRAQRHQALQTQTSTVQQPQHIKQEFSNHKLGSTKSVSKRAQTKRGEPPAAKPYACFSSSPTKPSPEKPSHTEDVEMAEAEEPTRPAASFHATTVNAPQLMRGIKRPAGLGRDGMASIDRLKKPFRPLTINRGSK
ncbi:putative P-loop containing nucleoside triphosphate hydrolase protein [Seiridium cardinale]|uniref:DNA 3'-5' helicase n=1 Tax=Seiridium cardinale TaxID=138064 RepID=A0ABR2XH09_9PEZI